MEETRMSIVIAMQARSNEQEGSRSGPRSNSYVSSSNTGWRINKTEPMNMETEIEVVEVGATIRYALVVSLQKR
jgi:hypothetical protein